jgi:hypothetical protein
MIDLEYTIGVIHNSGLSYAIKSHRNRNQNPGLDIVSTAGIVEWRLLGLQDGLIEADDEDTGQSRLDFYILQATFLQRRGNMPLPAVSPAGRSLRRGYPWGTRTRQPLMPGGPHARFKVEGSEMRSGSED